MKYLLCLLFTISLFANEQKEFTYTIIIRYNWTKGIITMTFENSKDMIEYINYLKDDVSIVTMKAVVKEK